MKWLANDKGAYGGHGGAYGLTLHGGADHLAETRRAHLGRQVGVHLLD